MATLRRTGTSEEAQIKKTKSLDHQFSSEANDYGGEDQIDFELDSHETSARAQDSITSADSSNGHMTGHVTLRKGSYEQAVSDGRDLVHLQNQVGGGDGAGGMGNVDLEMGTRRYAHDTELLPVCEEYYMHGTSIHMNYRIAGNFRGRKLSQISRI